MKTAALNKLEESLREQLRLSEQELAQLEDDLKGVDDELVVLANKRETFDKLEIVCRSLEELDDAGAGELFW